MANDKLKSDSMHLEPLDLGSLDDFLPDSSDNEKKGAVRRFAAGFKSGFLQQTQSKAMMRRFLRTALPDGYNRALAVADDTADTLKNIGYDLEQKHYEELDQISGAIEAALPKIKGRTSERLYAKLEQSLRNKREGYANTREYSKDPAEAARQRAIDADESAIKEALDGTNQLNVELAVAAEEAATDRAINEAKERSLRDTINKDRFDVMSRALSSIVIAQQKQVAFQDQITYRYQRKGLELQFRTFMALRDIRTMAQAQIKLHQEAYTALVKNTGLPDHLKSTKAEQAAWIKQQAGGGRSTKKVYNTMAGLMANFAPGMAENLSGLGSGAIQKVAQLLSGGEAVPFDLLKQQYQQDRAGFVGSMAGRGASMGIQSLLIPMLARRSRGGIKRYADNQLQGRHNQLSHFFDNAPAILQQFANDPANANGTKGYLQKAIRALVPQFALNDQVKDGNYQTIGKQASFNQLTQRSIVEIIPGYLARILQATRQLKAGQESAGLETYDITRGEFIAKDKAESRLTKKIVGSSNQRNISWALNSALDSYDSDGKLSTEARHALSERLLRDASTNKHFSAEAYANEDGYAPGTDAKVTGELTQFFRSKFKLNADGKMVANADNFKKQNDFSRKFVDIRNMTADPIGEINRLLETGNIGSLRAIGIVITADNQDKINYPRLWELYREGVTATNENPGGDGGFGGGGDPTPSGGGGPTSLKEQLKQAQATAQKHLAVIRSDASAAYNRYSPALQGLYQDGKSRLGAAYAGSRLAPFVASANARLQPHLLAGRQYGQNLLGQAHEAAMPLLQSMPAQEAKALLAQLPEVPQVNKASLVAKVQQAKNGIPPRLSDAEQHLLALVAQHGPGIQATLQSLPAHARGALTQAQASLTSLGGRLAPHLPDMGVWHKRAQDVAQRLQGHAQDALAGASAKVQDLYVKGKDQVAITAEELRSGELIDVTTQKVITSIDDITGTVIDKSGKIRLKASELRAGLVDVTGKAIASLRGHIEEVTPHVSGFLNHVKARIKGLFTEENGIISRVKDLYVENSREPILLARDMARGIYIDVETQKTIETVDDITGPVANAETQEILVTREDIQKGFTDVNGVKVSSNKLLRAAKWWGWFATRPVLLAGRTLKWATTKVAKTLYGAFFYMDAYLPPGKDPVLTARKLKRGEYFNEDGKVLTSFEDLRHGVFDASGQAVVEADDVPNLVNRDGTKHQAAKRKWAITKFTKRMAKGAFKGAAGAYWRGTKNYYNWLGKKMDDPFNKKVNRDTGEVEEVADPKKLSPTDRLLAKIDNTLKERLPGKGPAAGSAAAQLAAEEAEDAQHLKDEAAKRAERLAHAHGQNGGNIADLAKMLHGKGDDEDEGDTNINIDRDGRGRDRAGRRKPKGRFGKWLNKSKLGRGVGALGRGIGGVARAGLAVGADALLGTGASAAIGSGLSAAGAGIMGGLGTAAGVAGSAVAGAGSLLMAAITSPVLLGAAAIAAVGYGGYWLYSRNRDTSGDLRELRLLQYGSNSTGLSLKMLEAESIMEAVTSKTGTPDWTLNKEVAEKVMKVFGIDKDEPLKIAALAKWMDLRMKPVMMAYIAAVNALAQGNIPLNDLDDKFPAPQKAALLQAVKLPAGADGPYGCLVDPTGDSDPLEVTPADIEKKFSELKDKFAKDVDPNASPVKTATAVAAAATAATAASTAGPQPTPPVNSPVKTAQTDMSKLAGGGAAAVASLKGGSMVITQLTGGIISSLQSIRMRAYGLDTVDTKNVTALLSAETYMFKGVTYNRDGDAEWGGDPETLVQDIGPYFGINAQDPTDKDRIAFVKWVYYRFSPAFLSFLSAAHKADSSIGTLDAIEKLPASAKVQLANAVMTATADFDGDKQSIWMQPHIFPGNASAATLKDMAKRDLDVLNIEAEKEKVSTPTQSAQQQAAKAGTGASSNAGDQGGGIMSRMGDAVSSFGSSIATGASKAWQATKNFFGGSSDANAATTGQNAGTPYVAGKTPTYGGPLLTGGNVYEGFAKGTGGVFETIPLPSSNKSREAAMATLKAIEAMTGISAELLATFCSIESGFDYLIKAPTSSATGWFQFINDTWDDMIKRYGPKYGIPPDDAQRSHRKDPRINGLMGAEFLKGNAAILTTALGRAPSDVDLYCAHFFGAGTAAKFLKMDPNAIAALAFPKQADANKSIFYKGPGAPRTIREVYALLEEKVSKHRKGGQGTSLLMQTGGKEQSPVDAANAQAAAVASGATAADPVVDPATQTPAANDPGGSSVAAVASGSKFPLSMPSSGGSGNNVSSGAAPSGDSGGIPDPQPGDDAATVAAKAATKADQLKQAQTQSHMDTVKQATDIQAQQLAVQSEMRDYLKVIAQNLTSGGGSAPASGGNGIANPAGGAATRTPASTRAPISMSK